MITNVPPILGDICTGLGYCLYDFSNISEDIFWAIASNWNRGLINHFRLLKVMFFCFLLLITLFKSILLASIRKSLACYSRNLPRIHRISRWFFAEVCCAICFSPICEIISLAYRRSSGLHGKDSFNYRAFPLSNDLLVLCFSEF